MDALLESSAGTWTIFAACTGLIIITGRNLCIYGDVIADKTGLGRTWIGVILVASVTSLPEFITGASAVALWTPALPDIAVGNVVGSCLFNLLILVVIDAMCGKEPLNVKADMGHALGAGFGILLIGMVAFGFVAGDRLPKVGWFSLVSILLVLIYAVSMRVIFRYERWALKSGRKKAEDESAMYPDMGLKKAWVFYGLNALVVVGASLVLPKLGERISSLTGLDQSFVGNIFIALVTSLPELVVSITAIRLGMIDLAVGNVFGSNLFNIMILAACDFLYTPGPLLAGLPSTHLFAALGAIFMSAVMIIALINRQAKSKFLYLSWSSWALIAIYVCAVILMGMPESSP